MTVWHVDWEYLFIFQKIVLEISRSNFSPNICTCKQTVDIHREKVARREIGASSRLPRGFHAVIRLSHQQKIKKPRSSTPAHPSLSLAWTQSAMAWRWAHISFHEVGTEHRTEQSILQIVLPKICIGVLECYTELFINSAFPIQYIHVSIDLVSEGEKHSNAMANTLPGMKKRQCFLYYPNI